jgi:dienelactone hydrolase
MCSRCASSSARRFYEELALRFAERGIRAVAIDYFGRTAGAGRRGDDFPYMDHIAKTTPEQIHADVGAAVDYLRSSAATRAVFTIGFCFGGRHSWLPPPAVTVSQARSGSMGDPSPPATERPGLRREPAS